MNLEQAIEDEVEKMTEELADIEHKRWACWQNYIHSIFPKNEDGSITISPERVIQWERKIATEYADLTEKEKEHDRIEVRKYTPLIATSLHSIAIATADALKTRVAMEPTHPSENSPDIYGNARIEAYKNGYNSAISDSRQREQKWFGIEEETPLVDNKEA